MLGALASYVAHYDGKDFQPMNSNWGIVPPLEERIRDKREMARQMAERGLTALSGVPDLDLIIPPAPPEPVATDTPEPTEASELVSAQAPCD
jgi:hypothetical protein